MHKNVITIYIILPIYEGYLSMINELIYSVNEISLYIFKL